MPKHRVTQHRPQSDEKTRNKLLATLKQENHQLKRQISRLQKTLTKVLNAAGTQYEDDQQVEFKNPLLECPDCKQPSIKSIQLPFGNMLVCMTCGWRKKE